MDKERKKMRLQGGCDRDRKRTQHILCSVDTQIWYAAQSCPLSC